jgi:hypothetical protein
MHAEVLEKDRRSRRLVPPVWHNYDYPEDSDLEDEDDQTSELSELAPNVSAFDILDTASVSSANVDMSGAQEPRSPSTDTKEPQTDDTKSDSEVVFAPYAASKTFVSCFFCIFFHKILR